MSLTKPTIQGPHNGATGLGFTPTIRGKADPDCVVRVYVTGRPDLQLGPECKTDKDGYWLTGITVHNATSGATNSISARAERNGEYSDYADNVFFTS